MKSKKIAAMIAAAVLTATAVPFSSAAPVSDALADALDPG